MGILGLLDKGVICTAAVVRGEGFGTIDDDNGMTRAGLVSNESLAPIITTDSRQTLQGCVLYGVYYTEYYYIIKQANCEFSRNALHRYPSV